MTTRHLVQVTSDRIEELSDHNRVPIEVDNANARAYLTLGATTFFAELNSEVPC